MNFFNPEHWRKRPRHHLEPDLQPNIDKKAGRDKAELESIRQKRKRFWGDPAALKAEDKRQRKATLRFANILHARTRNYPWWCANNGRTPCN